MKVGENDARELFMALGYKTAFKWPKNKLLRRLKVIHKVPVPDEVQRPSHKWNKLLLACLKARMHGQGIIMCEHTDYQSARQIMPHKPTPDFSLTAKDGDEIVGESIDTIHSSKTEKGLNWYAATVLADVADANGWPRKVPTDDLVKRLVERAAFHGREVSDKDARYAIYRAKAVLHGYFTRLRDNNRKRQS